MRAATGLILLVAALLALLRWNYNGTQEAESALAHAKLRDDNLAREQEREDNRKLTLRAELTTNANLKLQLELTTLKARGEECKLQAAAQQQELQVQLEAAREQSRTQHIYAPSTAAASTAAASTSPLEANLARSQPAASAAAAASSRVAWVPANSSAAAAHAALESEPLLEVHRHWDWASIAKELLFPFESIDKRMLREGIKSCFDNGTMYCQRIQVKKGRLYLTDYRAIFFDRHYAPARIMPMLEVMRRHDLPDLDLVVAAVDEPRIKLRVGQSLWNQAVAKYPGGADGALPPPLFSSTINRGHVDLPWADFSFYMPRKSHKLRTPPWSELHPKMIRESAGVQWQDKIELAVHTGNVGSPFRKKLARAAEQNADTMLVNELFIGDHGKIKKTCHQLGRERIGGYQKHQCYMTFTEQCSYKYLINSASIGYANKFKYLLLCGSVVLYVQDGMQHKEFYEYGLIPGVHYISVATAADVPATVKYLQEHDSYARSVAAAGRARLSALDNTAIAAFYAELFRQYSRLQRFTVEVLPGAVEMSCEDDLWRHYARDKGWMRHYLSEDNSTCIQPIAKGATLSAPGWGGAYKGSKVRCTAAHDRMPRAQPNACNEFQPGTSFEPFDKFPSAHPKDPTNWATDGAGSDFTP